MMAKPLMTVQSVAVVFVGILLHVMQDLSTAARN